MKILKLMILVVIISIIGCFNMYNEANDDLSAMYKFFLAVGNNTVTGRISIFSINSYGDLAPVYQVSRSNGVKYVASSPSGDYLYATDMGGNIFSYSVDSNGNPTALNNQTAPNDPYSILIHPSGKYLYHLDNTSGNTTVFSIQSDGSISSSVIDTVNNFNPVAMAFHPSAKFLYILKNNMADIISVYTINSDGSLTKPTYTPLTISGNADKISIHPNGKYLYITNIISPALGQYDHYVRIYSINASDGLLTYQTNILIYNVTYGTVFLMGIHPKGNYILLTHSGETRIYSYNILSDGSLNYNSYIDGISGGFADLVFNPSGNSFYISDHGGDRIYQVNIKENGTFYSSKMYQFTAASTPQYYTSSAWGMSIIRKKLSK